MADPGDYDAYIARLFQLESNNTPNEQTGSNRGLGQFGPREEARYGINDQNRTSRDAQASAVTQEAEANSAALRKVLGRDPTPAELYLAHQQGLAGAKAHLTADPDTPAWQAIRPYYGSDQIAKQAIWGNMTPAMKAQFPGGVDTVPSSGFVSAWGNRFDGTTPAAPTQTAQAQPAQPSLASTMPAYPWSPQPQAQTAESIPTPVSPAAPAGAPASSGTPVSGGLLAQPEVQQPSLLLPLPHSPSTNPAADQNAQAFRQALLAQLQPTPTSPQARLARIAAMTNRISRQ